MIGELTSLTCALRVVWLTSGILSWNVSYTVITKANFPIYQIQESVSYRYHYYWTHSNVSVTEVRLGDVSREFTEVKPLFLCLYGKMIDACLQQFELAFFAKRGFI